MRRRWKILLSLFLLALLLAGAGVAFGVWFSLPSQKIPLHQPSSLPLPDRPAAVALVSATMEAFAQALTTKDFVTFYRSISVRWQKQTSPEKIAIALDAFTPFGPDVRQAIHHQEPMLNSRPLIDSENVLNLQGFYRIEATKMLFQLKYVYESSSWKLFGINVEVK